MVDKIDFKRYYPVKISMTDRKSLPIITKYELAALISTRAAEIADGQPITIKHPDTQDPREIAYMEYAAKRSPKKIIRQYPDGTKEVWLLSELQIV